MSQNNLILEHLKRHGSITPWEAIAEYGCLRLGARIAELKEEGYDIRKSMEKAVNRYGKPVSYAKYFIVTK